MNLSIDISNKNSVIAARDYLNLLITKGVYDDFKSPSKPNDVVADEEELVLDDDTGSEDLMLDDDAGDDLDALLGGDEEEPAAPTVDDLKTAFAAAVKAKGKDDTTKLVKGVFAKLKVKALQEIAEDKRQSFIDVMTKFAAK